MVAEGMAVQILFMSLKCAQTKMFAPEPQQHSEELTEPPAPGVFTNEQYNLQIQGVFFIFYFFAQPGCYRLEKKIKALYKLILLAHKVLLSSGA